MNSKEALEYFVALCTLNFDKEGAKKVGIIKKDLERLEKLEDIEEEFRINITSSVNLCKKVNSQHFVYTKENWGIDTIRFFDDLDVELLNHRLYSNSRGMYVSLDLHKYGVYWALTKKELIGEQEDD